MIKIIKDSGFVRKLQSILIYIAKDKPSAAIAFESRLEEKITSLPANPHMYRKSIYFNNNNYRDLIHQGYTVIWAPLKTLNILSDTEKFTIKAFL